MLLLLEDSLEEEALLDEEELDEDFEVLEILLELEEVPDFSFFPQAERPTVSAKIPEIISIFFMVSNLTLLKIDSNH
jgi:hypothetical protein